MKEVQVIKMYLDLDTTYYRTAGGLCRDLKNLLKKSGIRVHKVESLGKEVLEDVMPVEPGEVNGSSGGEWYFGKNGVKVCPFCRDEGAKSTLQSLGVSTTLLTVSFFNDENGIAHAHDLNVKQEVFVCSKDHRFGVKFQEPCPCSDCFWNEEELVRKPKIIDFRDDGYKKGDG